MAKTIQAVVNTGNPESVQVVDVVVGGGAKSQATRIKAVKGARYALQDAVGKEVPAEQVRTKRVGKHLHVALDGSDEADLVVENYFEVSPVAEGGAAAFGYVEAADVSAGAAAEAASDEFELAAVPVAAAGMSSPLGVVGGVLAAAVGGAGGAGGTTVGAGAAAVPLVAVKATYVGTGTVGNVVKLYDGNAVLASATVEINGTWRITSDANVTNPNALSISETGASGESAKMAASDFELDAAVLSGSAAPKVVIITDADNNGYVNAAELKIGGGRYIAQVSFDASKVTVGDKVVVSDGSVTRTVVLTQPDLLTGFVSVAFNAPKEGETLTVTAQLKDSTNSQASLVGTDSARLDTIAPNGGAAPVVEIITDVNNDGVVNSTELAGKLTFTVKASFDKTAVLVGEKVVFDTGSFTQTVVLKSADIANGYVTTQLVKPSEGGTLKVKAYVKDLAGQVSATSSTDTASLDTTAPKTTLTIDSISDDTGVAGDFITSDNNGLTVKATLSAGLASGEKLWYSNDNGVTWTNISADVVDKRVTHVDANLTTTNTVKMRVGDLANNFGAAATQLITIETGAPNGGVAPTVEITTDANNDGIVNFQELGGASTFTVKASFDKTKVKLGDKLIFNDGADHVVALSSADITNGYVTTTLAKPAAGGTLSVTGQLQSITGVNGAVSASDSAKLVLVDNSKATVSITTIDDVANGSVDSGVSNSDFITSDSTLIIKGTVTGFDASAGAAGDKVRVQVLDSKNAVVAEATVLPDASGNWSFDNKIKVLADGKYSIQAVIVDASGKTVNALVSHNLVIDTSGATEQPGNIVDPNMGASVSIVAITDDTGVSATDFITKDSMLTYSGGVTGFTPNGDLVKLELVDSKGQVIDSTYVQPSNGTWSWTRTAQHANGQYELRATIVDVAGNPVKDVVSDAQIIIVDTDGGKNTDPSKPITPSNPVGPVTDPNATNAVVSIASISDDTGSSASDFVTNDATLIVKGSVQSFDASTGDLVWVQIKDSNSKVVATQYVKPDASGNWTLNNTANTLADGKYTISADIVDVAGNPVKSGPTQALVIDTNKGGTDPAANPENGPTSPVDPNATNASIAVTAISTDNGVSANDYITADNTLVISGTINGFTASGGSAGDKVRVQVVDATGKVVAEKYMDPAATTWSFDNQANALANGDYVIKAAIVDKAGNVVKAAADQPLVINTGMISSQSFVNIFSISDDTGVSSTDFITTDRTLLIRGNLVGGLLSGEKLKLSILNLDGTTIASGFMAVAADYTWGADVTGINLPDGAYTIKAEVLDNTGLPFTLGRWDPASISWKSLEATHALVIDNSSINNPGNSPVADPNASAVMAITSIHDVANGSVDSGASSADFITNDSTLIIKGTITGYAASGGGAGDKVRVQIIDPTTNAVVAEQYVTADTAGNWSMDNRAKALVDGKYIVKASIVDLAGNPVNTVVTHDLVIDTNKGGTDPVVNPGNSPTTDPNAAGASIAITGISQDTGLSNSDYITSDSTLVINGSISGFTNTAGSAGDQVRVQIVSSLGVVVAEKYFLPSAATWSFDNQANSLADGNYTIKAAIVDAAGNPVKSAADQVLVINGGGNNNPNAYASVDITSMSDDTGVSASDFITSDTTLTYRGTVAGFTANGDVVKLQLIDSATNAVVETALVTPVGDTWTWTRVTAHTPGQYLLRASITDATGATTKGASADVQTVVVDTAGPAPVVVPQDNPLNPPTGKTSLVINSVTADDVINAAESAGTVAITGTVRGDFLAGDVVTLTINNKSVTCIVAADGGFSVNVSGADLAADTGKTIQASLVAHDKAGNPGTITATHAYGVSTVGPNGGVAPTLEITTDVNNDGLVSASELNGGNSFTAKVSFTSSKVMAGDQVVLDNGSSSQTITLTQNDVNNGFVTTSYAKPAEAGSLTLTATMINAAGTPSASSTDTAKLDTTGPVPVVQPQDNPLNPPAGKTSLMLDAVTSDNAVNAAEGAGTVAVTGTVRGEFVAGDVVTLTINNKKLTGAVAADGRFSIDVAGADLLADGDKTIDASVIAHDKAGNPGTITATQSYTVGNNVPNGGAAPVVEITTDGNNDGFVNSTELAGKTTFAVKASFDPAKVVAGTQMVFSDGTTSKIVTLSQTDVTAGFVSTVFAMPAEGSSLNVTAKLQDGFNNISASGSDAATLDTTAPTPVVLPQDNPLNPPAGKTSLVLDAVTADNTINATESTGTVVITGKARGEFVAGDVVTLNVNGKNFTTQLATDGSFSVNVAGSDLASDGDKTIEVSLVAHDKANNAGTIAATKSYSVDTSAVKVTIIKALDNEGSEQGDVASNGTTSDATPTLVGTATPNGLVTITDGSKTLGSVTADANGNWTFTPSAQSEGQHTYTASVSIANVVSTSNFVLTIDTVAPDVPTSVKVNDDVGLKQGQLQSGDVTDDTKPTVSGTGATPGDVVKLYDGAKEIGSTTVKSDGTWSVTPTTDLTEGDHMLSVTESDPAKNESAKSTPVKITVDTTAPTDPVSSAQHLMDDVGAVKGEIKTTNPITVTDDNKPTFSGTVSADAVVVNIFDGATLIATVDVDAATHTWTFTPSTEIADGTHSWSIAALDAAHNPSGKTTAIDFKIDTSTPPTPSSTLTATDDVGDFKGEIAANDVTDDNKPTFSGTGRAGDTVKVFDGATLIGTAVVGADGKWSMTPTSALADGSHSVTYVAVSPTNLESAPSPALDFKINTVPAEVEILKAVDDTGLVKGELKSGDATDDTAPTLIGTATANALVTISEGEIVLGSVVADANGNWILTLPEDTANLTHGYTATVQVAGNVATSSFVLSINTVAPAPVTDENQHVVDDVGLIQGDIVTTDPVTETDDVRPTISGIVDSDEVQKVNIYDGNKLIGSVFVNSKLAWAFTPDFDLDTGAHSWNVKAVNSLGVESKASTTVEFVVAAVAAPAAPALTSVTDNVGEVLGQIGKAPNGVNSTTDDDLPTFNGTGTAGTIVFVIDNGVDIIGSAVVDAAGKWSITPASALNEGAHSVAAVAVNAAGQSSVATGAYPFVVDLTAPAKPGTPVGTDDVGTAKGNIAAGSTTDDSLPTFSGNGTAGDLIKVYDGTTLIGTATVGADGKWSMTPLTQLAKGAHSITVVERDPAGNNSVASDPLNFNVDATAVNLTIVKAIDDVGTVQGDVPNFGITNDANPVLYGWAKPGSSVAITDETGATLPNVGSFMSSAIADANGLWVSQLPTQKDGTHTYTATVLISTTVKVTSTFTLTVDTVAPDVISSFIVTDDVGAIQGVLPNNSFTDDTTPTLSGSAAVDATYVNIYDGAALIGTAKVDPVTHQWSFTPSSELGQGTHVLSVTAVDKAGNESAKSPTTTITIDTTAPDAPSNLVIMDDVGMVKGQVLNDSTIDDTKPTMTGKVTSADAVSVNIYDGATLIGTASVDATTRAWTFTPPAGIATGGHKWSATAVDMAGNESVKSAPVLFKLVTETPYVPTLVSVVDNVGEFVGLVGKSSDGVNSTTDDNTPTFNGTGAPGAVLQILDKGVVIGSVTVAADGLWSFTSSAMTEGAHSIVVKAKDMFGAVVSTAPYTFNVDTAAPATPLAAPTAHDDVGPVQGTVGQNATTDDATPTIKGTGTAGNVIKVFDGNKLIGSSVVGADGTWSLTPTTPLASGNHSITYTEKDPARNESGKSPAINFTVDTSNVEVTITKVVDNEGSIQGDLATGSVTDDNTPTLVGTSTANALVTVTEGSEILGSVRADASGNWTMTLTTDAAQKTHSYVASVVNSKTGQTASTAPFVLTMDNVAPEQPSPLIVNDAVGIKQGVVAYYGTTDDTVPLLTGKGAAGNVIKVFDNGVLIGSTVVSAAGTWSLKPSTPLSQGDHAMTSTETDKAGNESKPSEPMPFVVDTTGPNATSTLVDLDDVTVDNILNIAESKTIVNLTGKVKGDYSAGDIVMVSVNGLVTTTTLNADGSYSVNVSGTDLKSDSVVKTTVFAHDAAGNAGVVVGNHSYIVDLASPDVPVIFGSIPLISDTVAEGMVTLTGIARRDYTVGDEVTFTINNQKYTTTINEDGSFEVEVSGADLKADADTLVDVSIEAHDKAGNPGTIQASIAYELGKPLVTGVGIDKVAGDEIVNLRESKGDVDGNIQITGHASGDYSEGDVVTLSVNSKSYTGTLDADGRFSIAVKATDVVADTTITASLAANFLGSRTTVTGVRSYKVDLNAPTNSTTSIFFDNVAGDTELTIAESQTMQTITGRVDGAFTVGDKIAFIINGVPNTTTVEAGGLFSFTIPGADLYNASVVKVELYAHDSSGNPGLINGTPSYTVSSRITSTSFTGTTAANNIIGTNASDTIVANGGPDTIYAMGGDDTVKITANNIAYLPSSTGNLLDGGQGVNLLQLVDTGATLDMTNATVAGRVFRFSSVDLTGTGKNAIKLHWANIVNMASGVADVAGTAADESKMVVITGNGTSTLQDEVQLVGLTDWKTTATTESASSLAATYGSGYQFVAGHTYKTYTLQGVTLIVDTAVLVKDGGAATSAIVTPNNYVADLADHTVFADTNLLTSVGQGTATLNGGSGVNTLKLGLSTAVVDLTKAQMASNIDGFSTIDLTGFGDNTLRLDINNVLNMPATPSDVVNGVDKSHLLVINGEEGDTLQTDAGWTTTATGLRATDLFNAYGANYNFQTGETYTQYTNGSATLLIDDHLQRVVV